MKNHETGPDTAREDHRMVGDFSVRVIRELRGALDEAQERELTVAQCDLLHREGELRLKDPGTGVEYVLVPVAEYDRLRGR
jgi:hypothetical protein